MEWLNYHHLYYFWVTAREGGFAAAGRKLRLSHSTIKAQVAQLEDYLDTKLFERRGRNLVLTDDGQLSLRYAEEIFGLGQEYLGVLRGQTSVVEHRLRIAAAHVVPKLLVRDVVEPALLRFPGARMGFFEGPMEQLLAGLATHEYDVVLSDSPLPPGHTVKAYNHALLRCPIVWLGPKELATDANRRRFPQCLSELPLLLPSRASAIRRTLDDWFEKEDIAPNFYYEFDDTALLKVFGERGHGVFPIPAAIENVAKKQTNSRRLAIMEHSVSFYAISPERRVRNPLLLEILEHTGSRGEVKEAS
ncbi:MAG: LysR family transcriptional regulator [Myxococcota bacterium]